MKRIVMIAVVGAGLVALASETLEQKNERLSAEYKTLQVRANNLRNDNRKAEKTIRVLGFTRELMDGTRKTPPKARIAEEVVFEEGWDKPIFFDAAEKTVKDRGVWLPLKAGSTYRFTGEVKGEGLKGGEGAQFQGYMPIFGDKPQWPGAPKSGLGSFDWRKVSFTFVMPYGAGFMFSFGPAKCTGRLWYRNIRGVELKEVYE